ncbi:MAG: hypothetical protein ACRDIU_00720, partial [Actinomycetota bacterium]
VVRNAEIYAHRTGSFSLVQEPSLARLYPEVSRLPDGRVVVAGGGLFDSSGVDPGKVELAGESAAELFDPATKTWATQRKIPLERGAYSATLLMRRPCKPNCGKLLLIGGGDRMDGALYDPGFEAGLLPQIGGKSFISRYGLSLAAGLGIIALVGSAVAIKKKRS